MGRRQNQINEMDEKSSSDDDPGTLFLVMVARKIQSECGVLGNFCINPQPKCDIIHKIMGNCGFLCPFGDYYGCDQTAQIHI